MSGGLARRFTRWRLWASAVLALATVLLAAIHGEVGGHVYGGVWSFRLKLVELALATVVTFGFGAPPMLRALRHARSGRVDLRGALCAVAILAYAYGLLALADPGLFPESMRRADTGVHPHFEAGALVMVVAFYLESSQLRSSSTTSSKGDSA